MFWLMIMRSFARGRRRKLLAVATVALGASLAAAMLALALDVGDKLARELRSYGANLAIKPAAGGTAGLPGGLDYDPLAASSYLDQEDLLKIKMIFWRHNIVGFAPFLFSNGSVDGRSVAVVGTWFEKETVLPTGETIRTGIKATKPWIKLTGAWPGETGATAEAVVGRGVAAKLGLRRGRTVELALGGRVEKIKIVGLVDGADEVREAVWLPLAAAQKALGLIREFHEAEVSALTTPDNELARKYRRDPKSLAGDEWEQWYCTPYVDAIGLQIEEVMPGARVFPIRQVAESEGAVLGKIQLLMAFLTITALAAGSLAVSSLMTAMVLERGREISLAKAIGAADSTVVLFFLFESAVVGLLGGTAGYGLGAFFAQNVGRSVFAAAVEVKPVVLPLTLLTALLVVMIGSLTAVRTIVGLKPREVLHG